jgi:signal peptidase II
MKTNRLTRLGLLLAVLVSCVGCDQVTKSIAARELAELPRQSFLGDTVRLEFALNPGAFLGMGGDLSSGARFWGLTVINGALLAILACVLITRWDMAPGNFAAWALILAGGIGNLIDRVSQQGLVTDFLNVGIGPFRTGIFNVADLAVTAGFALFVVVWWRDERQAKRDRDVGKLCHPTPPAPPC